jgi:hypothetical protein
MTISRPPGCACCHPKTSAARAQRLRERCHRELPRRAAPEPVHRSAVVWRRMIGPALIGAWGVIYLIVTFRSAAALYGLF